jgi:membrane protein YdbS with pleckstrin-like domain
MHSPEDLFSNVQLEVASLPEVEKLDMIPLEPPYRTQRYISGTIIALFLLVVFWTVALTGVIIRPYGLYLAGFMTLLSIWIIIYYGLSFKHMAYALREKDISFASGLFWRSMTTVPFNRVQHCDIKQGILDRRFGLARITIYTAGGQSTDLMIPGLIHEKAEKLKAYILGSTEQAAEDE